MLDPREDKPKDVEAAASSDRVVPADGLRFGALSRHSLARVLDQLIEAELRLAIRIVGGVVERRLLWRAWLPARSHARPRHERARGGGDGDDGKDWSPGRRTVLRLASRHDRTSGRSDRRHAPRGRATGAGEIDRHAARAPAPFHPD